MEKNNIRKEEFFDWCYDNDGQLQDYFNLIDSFNSEYLKKNDLLELDDSCIKNAKQMIVNLKYSRCFLPKLDDIYPTDYGTIIMDFELEKGILSLEIGNTQYGFYTDFENPDENYSAEETFDFQDVPGSLRPLLHRSKENLFVDYIRSIARSLEYIKHSITILSDVSEHRPDLCSEAVDNWLDDSYVVIRDLLDKTNSLISKENDFEEQFQSDPAIKNFYKEEDSSLDSKI